MKDTYSHVESIIQQPRFELGRLTNEKINMDIWQAIGKFPDHYWKQAIGVADHYVVQAESQFPPQNFRTFICDEEVVYLERFVTLD